MELERSAGVLLHPTSLPSNFGIGDLGPAATGYLDWLAGAGATWWQVLPLNPPGPGFSPYSATSTFAGNPMLISPELLLEDGLATEHDIAAYPALPPDHVEYRAVATAKLALLRRAWARFSDSRSGPLTSELEEFSGRHAGWLEDFARFEALKRAHGGAPWYEWPDDGLRLHDETVLGEWEDAHRGEVAFSSFCQFLFFRQWERVRTAARERGIQILGDVPIFVADDSAEVWAHRELFRMDANGRPRVVAGVPPDYFSATGQRWGNPIYDWDRHAADGFAWWTGRLAHAARLYDAIRLDHFRGFVAHWEIGASEETAVNGRWVPGPGRRLFDAVEKALGALPFVAEDLGTITEDVRTLRRGLGLPGMAILHFAFTPSPRSIYLPYNLRPDVVVYTGTHDNNTTLGWWLEDATGAERDFARRYMATDGREIHWDLVRLALASVSNLAVIPHQDLAGLGSDCRMNTPGRGDGNWTFRLTGWMLDPGIRDRFGDLVGLYGRDARE
ncbi:MAG: 4-alpha-glucanotransferase [Acidobacteria bacterium]|nr:4-alpha-glucanotransferase [Acidobacteriota bacterium]